MIKVMEGLTAAKSGLSEPIDAEKLQSWQISKIREAALRAMEKNTFYQRRFARSDVGKITSLGALERLPLTDCGELAGGFENFLCEPRKSLSRITSLRTSGSTGEPKRICFTENDLANMVHFFSCRIVPVIGSGKRLLIMMSNSTYGSIADLLKKGTEKAGFPAEIIGSVTDTAQAASLIKDGDAIVGLPADIFALANLYPALRPASVLLSADFAAPRLLEKIRNNWHCRIYTHYGLTETCFGCAVQCADGSSHHIRHEDLLIEIIDPQSGRQLPPGSEGEIVITTFGHEAMPLFRYRTGDISSLEVGRCPHCGSMTPRLRAVKGRLKNRIPIGDSYISIEKTDSLLYGMEGLISYSPRLSRKNGAAELELDVQMTEKFDIDKAIQAVKNEFKELKSVSINKIDGYNVLKSKKNIILSEIS